MLEAVLVAIFVSEVRLGVLWTSPDCFILGAICSAQLHQEGPAIRSHPLLAGLEEGHRFPEPAVDRC